MLSMLKHKFQLISIIFSMHLQISFDHLTSLNICLQGMIKTQLRWESNTEFTDLTNIKSINSQVRVSTKSNVTKYSDVSAEVMWRSIRSVILKYPKTHKRLFIGQYLKYCSNYVWQCYLILELPNLILYNTMINYVECMITYRKIPYSRSVYLISRVIQIEFNLKIALTRSWFTKFSPILMSHFRYLVINIYEITAHSLLIIED